MTIHLHCNRCNANVLEKLEVLVPRVVDTNARRDEICRAVWTVIARDGVEAVTLRAVAHTAGVSVGRIQHYYPNRRRPGRAPRP